MVCSQAPSIAIRRGGSLGFGILRTCMLVHESMLFGCLCMVLWSVSFSVLVLWLINPQGYIRSDHTGRVLLIKFAVSRAVGWKMVKRHIHFLFGPLGGGFPAVLPHSTYSPNDMWFLNPPAWDHPWMYSIAWRWLSHLIRQNMSSPAARMTAVTCTHVPSMLPADPTSTGRPCIENLFSIRAINRVLPLAACAKWL